MKIGLIMKLDMENLRFELFWDVNPTQAQYQIGVHRSKLSTQLDDVG